MTLGKREIQEVLVASTFLEHLGHAHWLTPVRGSSRANLLCKAVSNVVDSALVLSKVVRLLCLEVVPSRMLFTTACSSLEIFSIFPLSAGYCTTKRSCDCSVSAGAVPATEDDNSSS